MNPVKKDPLFKKNQPKVLIVDDKVGNLLVLEELLSGLNAQTIRATSGPQALKLTLEHDFALVLLDVQMPGMDGFEVATLLHNRLKTEHLPIIFVSAIYSGDAFRIKGVESGAIDFIEKPIIPELLIGKVRHFLALYEYHNSFKTIFAKVSDGVMIVDQSTTILMANAAAERIMGASKGSLIGSRFQHPMITDDISEVVISSKTNRDTIAELNISALKWQGENTFLISMRDITKREEMKRQARRVAKLEKEVQNLQWLAQISEPNSTITAKLLGLKPLCENTELFNKFVHEYSELLELAVEQRVLTVDHNLSDKLRAVTEELVFLRAAPRDIIDIHAHTLKKNNQRYTPTEGAGLLR
jgi:PAS domain S-box-containing protein